MALLPPYYNRELFSKHFLERLLPQQLEWSVARETSAAILTKLCDLYARLRPSPALREQQLEQKWIRPVLEALGVKFDVQVALPTDNPAVTLAPDYAVFGDPAAHQAARALQQSGQTLRYFDRVRMLGDAKRWGTNFASAAKGQKTRTRPSKSPPTMAVCSQHRSTRCSRPAAPGTGTSPPQSTSLHARHRRRATSSTTATSTSAIWAASTRVCWSTGWRLQRPTSSQSSRGSTLWSSTWPSIPPNTARSLPATAWHGVTRTWSRIAANAR